MSNVNIYGALRRIFGRPASMTLGVETGVTL